MSSPFTDIERIYQRVCHELTDEHDLCVSLLKIYQDLVLKISDHSQLQFNTLFARVSYITSKAHLNKAWSFAFQIPRRELRQRQLSDHELIPIVNACIEYLFAIASIEGDQTQALIEPMLPKLPASRKSGRFKKSFARVMATSWNKEDKTVLVLDEDEPGSTFKVHYSVPGVNDIFSDTLELALEEMGLPLVLGLVDINGLDEQDYVPAYIILLPDLLLDVTSIAEYVSLASDPPAVNLLHQFLPTRLSITLLVGKLANYFLDELMRDPELSFSVLFTASFRLFPLEFVRLSDDDLKAMIEQLKVHYQTIREVIVHRFPALGLRQEDSVIEPSYFSPQFGIKGRLDLYFQHEEEKSASIIELKSGKPFKPNPYGLSSTHYHQTLLYELLIKSVHGPQHYRSNFILYSAVADNPLRYAVSVESIQKETIHNRNQMVLLQYRLMNADQPGARNVLHEIDPRHYDSVKGFLKTEITQFHQVYSTLQAHEQAYLLHFAAFVAREHTLARIGSESEEGAGGLAALWLDTHEIKEASYQILRGMSLHAIRKEEHQTLITFQRESSTNPLANFRAGDIAVIYPFSDEEGSNPTQYQLHRANILSIDAAQVVIRLRNDQVNTRQIERIAKWNLEHDLLDSSFRSLYQSIWSLMCASPDKRNILLGCKPSPEVTEVFQLPLQPALTSSQQQLFKEGIQARFLYLLWGPPGTGKTSVMLRYWVNYYFAETNARILLLAYTNKAVDEICSALHQMGDDMKDHYLRIGSKAATGEIYRSRLLEQVISPMTRRTEIKKLLEETRVIVGTVASVQGKTELFSLVQFDVMMVDEASQLLEPAIVGLLSQSKKTILIGDHMQLPAVSVQTAQTSTLPSTSTWAEGIGLTDLRMSYFERLYRLYQEKGWHHLIGNLHEQGRMHQQIMSYVNRHIYQEQLSCIDPALQHVDLKQMLPGTLHSILVSRLIFIPTKSTLLETYLKTNQAEAEIVLELVNLWTSFIQEHHLSWSIGVITPFRAQIAAIMYLAHQQNMDISHITVDTVERYQGGARDIIIMSVAANHPRSLDRISSVNREGIDRKLNVAITRARQQFILVGIESVLRHSNAYSDYLDGSQHYSPEIRKPPFVTHHPLA